MNIRTHLARPLALLCAAATVAGSLAVITARSAIAAPAQHKVHITRPAQFVVPYGVTSIQVNAVGGSGEAGTAVQALDGTSSGGTGGLGGTTSTRIAVTGGETLDIVVGRMGQNGAFGDALSQRFAGGTSVSTLLSGVIAGAGGSASAVLRAGQPLVVAGGGGGGAEGGTNGAAWFGGGGGNGGGNPGVSGYGSGGGGKTGPGNGGIGTTSSSRGEDGRISSDPTGLIGTFGGSSGAGGGGMNGGIAGNIAAFGAGGGGMNGGIAGNIAAFGAGGGGGAGGTSYSVSSDVTFGSAAQVGDGSIDLVYDGPYLLTSGSITTVKNPSLFGENVAFTLTLAWSGLLSSGVANPTGTVTFGTYDSASGQEATVGTMPVSPDGTAVFRLPAMMPLGWTNVWAAYAGDDNHSPYKANYYQQQVVPGPSSFLIDPAILDFGNQNLGSVTYRDVTVTNTGAAPWQPVRAASSNAAFAILATTCTGPLAPTASCKVTVQFTPSAAGPVSGAITLTDGAGNTATLPLTGTGAVPVETIAFNPATYNFGNQLVGSSTETTVTVTNIGTTPWTFIQVGTDEAAFSQPTHTCTAPIAPSGTCTITFRFHPTAAGPLNGHLTVYSTTGQTTVYTVTGTGIAQTTTTTTTQPQATTTTMSPTTTTTQPQATTTSTRPTTTTTRPATSTTARPRPTTTTTQPHRHDGSVPHDRHGSNGPQPGR
jgi:hypothetical protein